MRGVAGHPSQGIPRPWQGLRPQLWAAARTKVHLQVVWLDVGLLLEVHHVCSQSVAQVGSRAGTRVA